MLTGIHFLLTYRCNYECDHCFLYCSPRSKGTFTLSQIKQVLAEAEKIGTVNSIYYEGGEPFLYYPILVESLRLAQNKGIKTGVVTNCYWATGTPDAHLWLRPMIQAGLSDLSMSDDAFHAENPEASPAKEAAKAATELGMASTSICIQAPEVSSPAEGKGEPVIGGGTLFKGRAAEKLTDALPTKPIETFTECTHEELIAPKRVHIDSFGNVMVCQGISIGNMWQTPLSELIENYDAKNHPICGPLIEGGPKRLAEIHNVAVEGEFVDECHFCYLIRKALIDRFPKYLAPRQVYGLDQE